MRTNWLHWLHWQCFSCFWSEIIYTRQIPIWKWYKRRINAIRTRLVAKLISMQNVFFIHLVIALVRSVHDGSLFCTHLFRFPCAQWIIHMHKWFSVKLTHHHHNHHLFNESVGMCSKKFASQIWITTKLFNFFRNAIVVGCTNGYEAWMRFYTFDTYELHLASTWPLRIQRNACFPIKSDKHLFPSTPHAS